MYTHDAPTLPYREALLRILLRSQERQNSTEKLSPTKAKILAVAMSMFTKSGYAGTSMRDIAARVGIKAASLYSHCPGGKDELLSLGLDSILDEFQTFVIEDIRFDLGPLEQLEAVVSRHVRWQLDLGETAVAWDAAINQFGVAGVLPEQALEDIRSKQMLYSDYVRALVDAANEGPSPSETAAAAILLLCNGAHRFLPPDGRTEAVPATQRDDVIERVWTLVLALLSKTA